MSDIKQPLIDKDDEQSEGPPSYFKRLFYSGTYNKAFIGTLGSLYVNGGMKILYFVVFQEMLRNDYKVALDKIQIIMPFILTPWTFKMFYGIICDTVRIPFIESFQLAPRRGYLLIFSMIQFICLMVSGLFKFDDYTVLVWLLWTSSLCGAFMDVVIDGICCVQQRKDPVSGAQDLQTFSWVSLSVSTIVAGYIGAKLYENSEGRYSFILYGMVVFFSIIFAYNMPIQQEGKDDTTIDGQDGVATQDEKKDQDEVHGETFCNRVKNDWSIIYKAFQNPIFYRFQLFWIIKGFICPNFTSYTYQQQKAVYKFDQTTIAQLKSLGSIGFLLSLWVYQMFLKKSELRTNTYIAQVIVMVGLLIELWQVQRYNLEAGFSDFVVQCFSYLIMDTITHALTFLPFMVMVQKLAPEGVEATILATMFSLWNLTTEHLPEWTGAYLNHKYVGMTAEKTYLYKYLLYIKIGTQLICFLAIHLIPLQKDLADYTEVFEEEEKEKEAIKEIEEKN